MKVSALLSLFVSGIALSLSLFILATNKSGVDTSPSAARGYTDASDFGFLPEASGLANTMALQNALDKGGMIVISRPGIYSIAGTLYIGSNTTVSFGNGVFLKKTLNKENKPFSHVFLNKGALTKTYDEHIAINNLNIIVNGIDARPFKEVYGLSGQLAFFYIKDLVIRQFRCLDLGKLQNGIQICTFEDIRLEDIVIKGYKDAVHLGRGKRFTIRDGVFQTVDDAIALCGHDYSTGNPELGWIEDGLIENCHDLADPIRNEGYFARIVAGAWIDWKPGMKVQQSDTVVSNGQLYRVQENPDGTVYTSTTQPVHEQGCQVLDGIHWGVVQNEVTYTAGVRNVTFRDLFLHRPRTLFSLHFDKDKFSRSYYPGAQIPQQEGILFDNVHVLFDDPRPFLEIRTSVNSVTIINSTLRNNKIVFHAYGDVPEYGRTVLNLIGCIFLNPGNMEILSNSIPNKEVIFKTTASTISSAGFGASIYSGSTRITVDSDLPGLNAPLTTKH